MARRSKVVLALVVLVVAGAIGAAYAGMVPSIISPDQLPGSPVVGGGAIVAVVVLGVLVSLYLDRRAWRQTGRAAGLTAGGGPQFGSGPPAESDKATLTGTVDGRPVRARTYSTDGGRNKTSKTFTVVEAELASPVDWHASFGVPDTGKVPDDPGVDAAKTQVVDGIGVRGDVSGDVVRSVLTTDVKDAISPADGGVAVGSARDNILGDMLDELDDSEAGGMASSFAKSMLHAADDGDDGPSRTVEHRDRGLLTDEAELDRRIRAVTALADAVDRVSASADPQSASTK